MKKLLTAILVVAMIASIAAVASFADYDPLTITAGTVEVEEGATEAIVPITISGIPTELGISSITVTVKAEGTTLSLEGKLAGQNVAGDPAESVSLMWADVSKGCKEAEVLFAEATVAIPEGAKAGDEITVEVLVSDDPDNYLSFEEVDGDTVGFGATGVNGKITVVEAKPVDSGSGSGSDSDSDSDSAIVEPIGSEDQSGEASETEAAGTEGENKGGKTSPQTSDVAIIVVVAMVVALGTAIVVKKVNVK